MGNWQERIKSQAEIEENSRLQDRQRHQRESETREAAKRGLEEQRRKEVSSTVEALDIIGLFTSLNQEVWRGLGIIERTQGKGVTTYVGWKSIENPDAYWEKVSLIFRYKKYAPEIVDVTELRFGRYTVHHSYTSEPGGESGETFTREYDEEKFGFHTEVVGHKTAGVKQSDESASLGIKVLLFPPYNPLIEVHGRADGDWIQKQFPYNSTQHGVDVSAATTPTFSFDKSHPLARAKANEILTAILAKDSLERSGLGILPPQLKSAEEGKLARIQRGIGQIV